MNNTPRTLPVKHLHTLIVFLLTASLYAQTLTTVFNHEEILGPSMAIHGNELYFSGFTNIFKIDLTQTNPTAVEVVEVMAGSGLLFHGDELYFSTNTTISKIDITDQTPTIVDVITSGINNPFSSDLIIRRNELYVSDWREVDNVEISQILKIDVTESTTTATHVIDVADNLNGLAFHGDGNELYFVTHDIFTTQSGKVLKIDISQTSPTPTEILTGLNQPRNLIFDGNDLYISLYGDNKISKIDVTDDFPALTDVVSMSTPPDKLIIDGAYLYIATNDSEDETGYILRYTDSTLDFGGIYAQTPSLYPNPAQDQLYVSHIGNAQQFAIYNLLGAEIAKGRVSENTPIDIKAFTKGLYLVRLENGLTLKFVKN